MIKKLILSVILIALMTTIVLADQRARIEWEVTIYTCETPVHIKTYYLDNNLNICKLNTETWNGVNPYTREEDIWPPSDPPPLYMCVEAWTENYYDEDQTNDVTPPSELEVHLGVAPEDPPDEPGGE
jgi:hypothetical protein